MLIEEGWMDQIDGEMREYTLMSEEPTTVARANGVSGVRRVLEVGASGSGGWQLMAEC